MIARLSLLCLFISISFWANAQSDSEWYRVDTLLLKSKNLQQLRREVFQMREEAMQKQDYGSAARCFNYLMKIAGKTTEDTMYFRNALFMDSILNSPQSPQPLKAIVHVMKAKRIKGFSVYFSRQNKILFSSHDPSRNYSVMSLEQLDSVADLHLEQALQISRSLGGMSAKNLIWLATDPGTFLFEPAFEDIIHAERINMFSFSARESAELASHWLRLSPDEFVRLDSLNGFKPKADKVFGYYKQWLQYQAANSRAYYFIETLARKYFFKLLDNDSLNNSIYENYLQNLLASPYNTVKAHAVYQLCLLWNEEARAYNPYYSFNSFSYPGYSDAFKEKYRMHHVKALELFRRHEQVLDSFPVFKTLLHAMAIKIQEVELGLTMEDDQLPGRPMVAALRFRNARNLYMRVIRWNVKESFLEYNKKANLERFKKAAYIQDTVINLKTPDDYQPHNAFIRLNPLPAGRYIILYSDSVIAAENKHLEYLDLDVTRLAAINNDDRIFVLDRETGLPVVGAQVSGYSHQNPQTVNNEGYATIDVEKHNNLVIWYKSDTLYYSANEPEQYEPEELYDTSEYLDLLDYYEEQVRLHLFTDRAIYRPGQTVHYKGIFMVRHPRTGEQLVLNWRNLKFPFFKKLFFKLVRSFSGLKMEIYIKDPFDNERDTILALPDKFGSIAGSFKIPADAATGEWEFETDDAEIDFANSGLFNVEEYKRPTFEIKLEKPVGYLQLGDSFTVKAMASSFAGAQLNNVLVNYSVSVSGRFPKPDGSNWYRDDSITAGEAYTNENGELLINITDKKIAGMNMLADHEWVGRYHVEVKAVDATGESHEAKGVYALSTRPVNLELTVPHVMERSEMLPMFIAAKSDFGGYMKKPVKVKIFSTEVDQSGGKKGDWPAIDTWLYDSAEFIKWFPEIKEKAEESTGEVLVHETTLIAGDTGKLILPAAALPAGSYRMEIVAHENEKIIGEVKRSFFVFDKSMATLPDMEYGFEFLPYNSARNGEKITWYTGNKQNDVYSIYHAAWYEKSKNGYTVKYHYTTRPEKKGLNKWEFRIPEHAIDNVAITHLYILNNRLYKKEKHVYISKNKTVTPEIIVEKYRTKLAPGAKETFAVSIKTKNTNLVAQLMTTMYDATLDKLAEHKWTIPYERNYIMVDNAWSSVIDGRVSSNLEKVWRLAPVQYGYSRPLWWLNPLDYGYDVNRDGVAETVVAHRLEGKMAGINITDTRGLGEVVVVGYGSVKNMTSSQSVVVSIRGNQSLASYGKILYVLDGEIFEGDISAINVNTITQGILLKGADATAIYGSRAANGVLLLSTKGPVQLPGPPKPPAPVIRKNFSETAFFYPRIHAGPNGVYTIKFTLSESVTTWKWKMLAHTKKAIFSYLEKTVISQLPLMVQPDMPRFLYQGDKIILKSRISNLDTANCSGKLECRLEDMVTGEDITKQLVKTSNKDFSVVPSSNTTGSFEIAVPETLLHPIRIRITAQSSSYSDGEEHVIPILARKILVSRSVPVVLNDQQTNIAKPTLPADAQPYGMALFITPQPQAALINALPWLANYPYGCAEQTFNKMLAHALAIKMVRTDTTLQQLIARNIFTKSSGPAPGELPEESMPWLQLNNRHAMQQQQLAKLFDTVKAHLAMQKFFDELIKLQNGDGGITWFAGGKSNDYISAYILAGFGKLMRDDLPLPDERITEYMRLIFNLVNYCDAQFLANHKNQYRYNSLFYLYARSFYAKRYPIAPAQLTLVDSLIAHYWQNQSFSAVGSAAMLAIATIRILPKQNANYAKAFELLESLRQSAIRDEKNGIRWKTYADADALNMQTEEWVVKTAEAFEEDINDKETIPGMITWLLKTRNEYSWSTTKSTADAVSLLHRKQSAFIAKPSQMDANVDNASLRVSNNLFNGSLFSFADMAGKNFPQQTTVTAPVAQGQSGGINYYYFTSDPPSEESSAGVKIVKAIAKFNSSTSAWEAISAATILRPGDKIRTTLTITTQKQLQYVFIDEKRAATCEPVEALSGYESGKGIYYYKSVRDVGFQFFADDIPSGTSEISYETVIAKTGRFTYGPAVLQCMYRPDVKAWSNSLQMEVKE